MLQQSDPNRIHKGQFSKYQIMIDNTANTAEQPFREVVHFVLRSCMNTDFDNICLLNVGYKMIVTS